VRLALLASLALAGCNSCQPAAAPTDQSVYNALVSSGCLAASDGGVAAVAAEHASPNPAWLACMYTPGATVAGCAVPCN
jgi:hypothetical protein